MINIKIPIRVEGSLSNVHATTYILDTPDILGINKRPLIIICPGGGYDHVSLREGEPVAIAYNNMGYHSIVLEYSVAPATYPVAMSELAKLVSLVHEKADEWKADRSKIFIQGFSAGGHLAACYAINRKKPVISSMTGYNEDYQQIAGLLLAYPVISTGNYAHKRSFEKLLGLTTGTLDCGMDNLSKDITTKLAELSLEKNVNRDLPPCFIWTTFEDASVPAENAIAFMLALREQGIVTEFHMFPYGGHGLSLASELTSRENGKDVQKEVMPWIDLAKNFIQNNVI